MYLPNGFNVRAQPHAAAASTPDNAVPPPLLRTGVTTCHRLAATHLPVYTSKSSPAPFNLVANSTCPACRDIAVRQLLSFPLPATWRFKLLPCRNFYGARQRLPPKRSTHAAMPFCVLRTTGFAGTPFTSCFWFWITTLNRGSRTRGTTYLMQPYSNLMRFPPALGSGRTVALPFPLPAALVVGRFCRHGALLPAILPVEHYRFTAALCEPLRAWRYRRLRAAVAQRFTFAFLALYRIADACLTTPHNTLPYRLALLRSYATTVIALHTEHFPAAPAPLCQALRVRCRLGERRRLPWMDFGFLDRTCPACLDLLYEPAVTLPCCAVLWVPPRILPYCCLPQL